MEDKVMQISYRSYIQWPRQEKNICLTWGYQISQTHGGK
jgi:hypothetical protein